MRGNDFLFNDWDFLAVYPADLPFGYSYGTGGGLKIVAFIVFDVFHKKVRVEKIDGLFCRFGCNAFGLIYPLINGVFLIILEKVLTFIFENLNSTPAFITW